MLYAQLNLHNKPAILSCGAPKFLYHGTFDKNVDDILKYGLRQTTGDGDNEYKVWPDSEEGYVYLTSDPATAMTYPMEAFRQKLESVEYIEEFIPVVIKVHAIKLELGKLARDPNRPDKDWRYDGVIPPEALAVHAKGKKVGCKDCPIGDEECADNHECERW